MSLMLAWEMGSTFMRKEGAVKFEVVVGNVGTIYSGENACAAHGTYRDAMILSASKQGRASGESITLLQDGEVVKKYEGEGAA